MTIPAKTPPPIELEETGDGYEKRDVNLRMVVVLSVASALLVIGFSLILNEYFLITKNKIYEEQVLAKESPRLIEYQRETEALLNSFGEIEGKEGTFRIPVESAMELLVKQAQAKSAD